MPAKKSPAECADLSDVRVEIDRCDKALVDMIAERFGYVERAWQIKLGLKQEANVPWRNQQVIDRVRARADEKRRAARPLRGAVAADDRLVHPVRGGEAARPDRGGRGQVAAHLTSHELCRNSIAGREGADDARHRRYRASAPA